MQQTQQDEPTDGRAADPGDGAGAVAGDEAAPISQDVINDLARAISAELWAMRLAAQAAA